MFKLFKRVKETRYVVMLNDNILYQGWAVARFTTKEAAQEYCDFKNRTNTDPTLDWWVFELKKN